MRIRRAACIILFLISADPALGQSRGPAPKDDIAMCVICDPGEGVNYILDIRRDASGRPLRPLSFAPRGQICRKGDTVYRLSGFPGAYRSPAELRQAIGAMLKLRSLSFPMDEASLVDANAFVKSIEDDS